MSVLERHEEGRVALRELEREPDGAVRTLLARRVHDLGPVQAQEPAAFLRHVVRHDAGQRIAAKLRQERERDPGVAARRLEQAPPPLELAGRLGGVEHRLRDAVLDRAGGVLALQLREELDGRSRGEAGERDEGSRADQVEERGGERSGHGVGP
jgi:hypothetical protein